MEWSGMTMCVRKRKYVVMGKKKKSMCVCCEASKRDIVPVVLGTRTWQKSFHNVPRRRSDEPNPKAGQTTRTLTNKIPIRSSYSQLP